MNKDPQTITRATWLVMKILFIVGVSLYAVFAWVIVRQEHLMAKVLETKAESLLRMLAMMHAVASVVVVGMAIVLL